MTTKGKESRASQTGKLRTRQQGEHLPDHDRVGQIPKEKIITVTLGDDININLVRTCVMYQTQKAFHSKKWVLKIEVGETQ